MKKQPIYLILSIAIFFFSCQEKQTVEKTITVQDVDQSYEIKKIIDEHNAAIVTLYGNGNIDSAAFYFAENCIQMPPNSKPMRGKEEYVNTWKQNIQFGQWDFNLKAQEVKVSGDLAVELGIYTLSFEANETSPFPSFEDKGNYLVLWENIDGEWKIVWDAPVSEVPMGG